MDSGIKIKVEDIKKTTLIPLLKKEDLEVGEIDVWNCVIKWGIRRIKNLKKNIYFKVG